MSAVAAQGVEIGSYMLGFPVKQKWQFSEQFT
jgi:hypothetical protein